MKYYVFNKPFNVLSQFTGEPNQKTLSDFLQIEKDCYPVGRLDYDSEGLIIITNDKRLNDLLLNPKNHHKRDYLVQVDGEITANALMNLTNGININIKGKSHFVKCLNVAVIQDVKLPDRVPPIRFRENIPTTIIRMTLTDGKNRQVRRMTAAVGFPTLRLIRISIENIKIDNIPIGEFVEYSQNEIYKILNINLKNTN